MNTGGPLTFTDREVANLVQLACFVGNLEALKLLVKKGADLSVTNSDNTTCLHKVHEKAEIKK
jgi:ankyrin repeat protein